jgi:hypothetical protein
MSRWIWIPLLALSYGCGDSSDPTSTESAQTSAEETTPSEAVGAVEEATEGAAEAAEGARDLAGISAEMHDDGTITISGSDRWGGPLEYTYADSEYLKNAVPVLARSITEEQATALAEYVEELRGEEGEDQGGEPPAVEEATGGSGPE